MTALELATLFHETYEKLVPQFSYETRTDTKEFDPASSNGRLMVATCKAVLERFSMENVHPTIPEKAFRGTITKDGNVMSYKTDPAWDRLSDEALDNFDRLSECSTLDQLMDELNKDEGFKAEHKRQKPEYGFDPVNDLRDKE